MYMANYPAKCGLEIAVVALALWSSGATGQQFWRKAEWNGPVNLPTQAVTQKPIRFVRFDLPRLSTNEAARLLFPLPDGSSILLERSVARRSSAGGVVWSGRVHGDDRSIATLSILNDTLVGDVVSSKIGMYRIEQLGDGIQVVFELGRQLFGKESEPSYVTQPSYPRSDSVFEEHCDQRVVEMLVVYTKAACMEAFIGDNSNECGDFDHDIMRSRIQQAEAETNTIFQNSLASPRVSIVHAALVDEYVEEDSIFDDLQNMRVRNLTSSQIAAGKKAPLQSVHDLRDQFGADVVALITRRTGAYPHAQPCGKSMLMTVKEPWYEEHAFMIVPFDCMTSNFSFTHELGHVMGADHQTGGSVQPSFMPGNRAHVNAGPFRTTSPWRTVMAENDAACTAADPVNGCKRLPYFSNPDSRVLMGGDKENNSGVVSSTVYTVSGYRSSLRCNSD